MAILKFVNEDSGSCRVYYRAAGRLYCWQMDEFRTKEFGFYVCSRDGEPSHLVTPFDHTPIPRKADSITLRDLRAFLAKKGA